MEFLFAVAWRLGLPLVLAALTTVFLPALLGVTVSAGVFFTVALIWAVVINGGFLLLDGDLNLFD